MVFSIPVPRATATGLQAYPTHEDTTACFTDITLSLSGIHSVCIPRCTALAPISPIHPLPFWISRGWRQSLSRPLSRGHAPFLSLCRPRVPVCRRRTPASDFSTDELAKTTRPRGLLSPPVQSLRETASHIHLLAFGIGVVGAILEIGVGLWMVWVCARA